jgi:uncharacterized protein
MFFWSRLVKNLGVNMNKPKINKLVEKLNLKPLWSKDYLVEFYRSEQMLPREIIGENFDGDRPIFNWAYYLLPEDVICPFHLHLADESWQLCLGGPLELFIIYPQDGQLEKIVIGEDILGGQKLIYITPKNVWFAAKTARGAGYTLITHMVAPAFFPQDKIKGYYDDLVKKFPQHEKLIREFAWPQEWNNSL